MTTNEEIVMIVSKADWDLLRGILVDAIRESSRSERPMFRAFAKRLAQRSDTLTLSWFDRELEKFHNGVE